MKTPKVGAQGTPTTRTERWRPLQTQGATVILNGGTVEDIAGGLRVTFPGSSTTADYGAGLTMRWPARYEDGSRVQRADMFSQFMMVRQLADPDLSGDSYYCIGLVAAADSLIAADGGLCFGGGIVNEAGTRAEFARRHSSGVPTDGKNLAPTGNARGGAVSGMRYQRGGTGAVLRYWGVEGVAADGAGLSGTDSVATTYGGLGVGDLDVFLAVGRSAATLGAISLDIAAEAVFVRPR